MTADIVIRRARAEDAEAVSRLINGFADEALMLRRTPEMVELAIDDYVVGVTRRGEILACGALKEYSPSVAEVAAIAVSREVHVFDVFALTLQPAFFSAIGYQRVDRARYPEKIRRDCLACARRFACNEICFAKNLRLEALAAA